MKIFGTENNKYILKELGMRLRDTRIGMSFTQEEMAERAGISTKTIERIEKGHNVKIEGLLNLMRAMGLLQNMEVLIPEQTLSPTIQHDYGKKRVRAASKKTEETDGKLWKWEDEEK